MDGHTGKDKHMSTSLWSILRSSQYLKLHGVRTVGWLTNERDEICKAAGAACIRTVLPWKDWGRPQLCRQNKFPIQNSNQACSEDKSRVLPRCSVTAGSHRLDTQRNNRYIRDRRIDKHTNIIFNLILDNDQLDTHLLYFTVRLL